MSGEEAMQGDLCTSGGQVSSWGVEGQLARAQRW